VDNYSTLLSRIFWILFTSEAIGYAALAFSVMRPGGKWGPEGPVGAGVVLIAVPILLGIPLIIVLVGRSPYAALYGIVLLSWPLIGAVVGPIYSALQSFQAQRDLAGDNNFIRPTQRKLAHALRDHNVEQVRALLPSAGDLNAEHRGTSLFEFGMSNLDQSAASEAIVRAMLDAGARPRGKNVLFSAMHAGPAVTEMVLASGADPNLLDSGRPVWWNVLYDQSERGREILAVVLDHGADMRLQDGELGPVGWAAYLKNWRAVWLLMERGAPWKDQRAFEQPIPLVLEGDFQYKRAGNSEIPVEMEKIAAKYREEM
jgi:hypothetical protein